MAAAIALVVEDDRAAGRVYNVSEPVSFREADWVRRIAEVIGWTGEVATVPEGRIPVPYHFDQDLDTNSHRIREELRFAETVLLHDALERTIAWERTNPPEQWSASESWMTRSNRSRWAEARIQEKQADHLPSFPSHPETITLGEAWTVNESFSITAGICRSIAVQTERL